MAWQTAVTNRTLLDIQNRTPKGFFNVVDWVRISGNSYYIKTLLEVLKAVNVDFESLDTPTITTIPLVEDINSFVSNLETLRELANFPDALGVIQLKTDYRTGGGTETPDYEDINAWENNLKLLKKYLIYSSTYEVFCGVASAGQARFWQNRFRTPFVKSVITPGRWLRCGVGVCGTGITRQNKFRRYA